MYCVGIAYQGCEQVAANEEGERGHEDGVSNLPGGRHGVWDHPRHDHHHQRQECEHDVHGTVVCECRPHLQSSEHERSCQTPLVGHGIKKKMQEALFKNCTQECNPEVFHSSLRSTSYLIDFRFAKPRRVP